MGAGVFRPVECPDADRTRPLEHPEAVRQGPAFERGSLTGPGLGGVYVTTVRTERPTHWRTAACGRQGAGGECSAAI